MSNSMLSSFQINKVLKKHTQMHTGHSDLQTHPLKIDDLPVHENEPDWKGTHCCAFLSKYPFPVVPK